jgi:hypothetical protein
MELNKNVVGSAKVSFVPQHRVRTISVVGLDGSWICINQQLNFNFLNASKKFSIKHMKFGEFFGIAMF